MNIIEHPAAVGQPQLPLELAESVPAPRWAEVIDRETEGDQDSGWWGA